MVDFWEDAVITIVKLDHQGEEKIQYLAEIHAQVVNGVVLDAYWQRPRLELGYTLFEPGDHFREYFYTDRWFNIFAIATAQGKRKGWYCNVAMPARIDGERIEQVDLLLDVWVGPDRQIVLLDEDEFAAAVTLTEAQRLGARQGLQDLLALIQAWGEPFREA